MWVPVGVSRDRPAFGPGAVLRSCTLPGFKLAFKSLLKIISLLMLALMLPACSAIKLAYNQAPDLVYWYLDGYADFTDAQTLGVKADLAGLHAWHRQTQMPAYAGLLQDLQRQILADFSSAQACTVFGEAKRRFVTIIEQAEPSVAAVAQTLQADQLKHMEGKFAKVNAEFRKDFFDGSRKDIRTRRVDKAVDRAEKLYGRLDDKQTALVGRLTDESVFDATRTHGEWQRRQRDTVQTLRELMAAKAAGNLTAERSRTAVRGLLDRYSNSPDSSYRDYADQLAADACRSFSALHNTTSAAQRSKAASTLNNYAIDLQTLAAPKSP